MKMHQIFGYIRVSTKEQNERRQLDALSTLDIPKRNLYLDKQSGKDFERPAYMRMIARLHAGDVIYVKSIDRLGRNYEEIIEQWRIITKEKQADIIVLDMPLLNTARSKDLLGTLIADIVLQLLSFVAENERESIRQRQAEGIAAAKARGVRFGRPNRTIPPTFEKAYEGWKNRKLSIQKAATQAQLPYATFRRLALKRLEEEGLARAPKGKLPTLLVK